jgi:segregation and condensation protein B
METPIGSSAPSSQQKKLPIRNKVEAILFASGSRISLQDITRLARGREDAVKEALIELKMKYDNPEHSLILINDGDYWKLAVRDHYLSVVKKIVTETELSKTVLETLAVIAFKYPIKQSDLIHIRTNKAYDHLKELESQGFISRKKHGRTNLIKLTEKFFQYFDLPEEKLKQHLADFQSIAAAIAQKEAELHERKAQQARELEELKSKEDTIKQAIDALDEPEHPSRQPSTTPLETYGTKEEDSDQKTEVAVYDVPPEEALKEPKPLPGGPLEEPSEEQCQESRQSPTPPKEAREQHTEDNEDEKIQEEANEELPSTETEELPETHFDSLGIQPTLEQEKEIDEKVEKLLHPPKEKTEPDIEKDEDELEEELDKAKQKRRRED